MVRVYALHRANSVLRFPVTGYGIPARTKWETMGHAISRSRQHAADRVRARTKEWVAVHGHGSQRKLALAVLGKYGEPRSDSWISDILNGRADVSLRDLDALAEAMGIPPGDLVRRDDDHYLEVIPSEMRFLAHLRTLPDTVRQHLLGAWDYIFGFQDRLLKEQRATVDKRTKVARMHRAAERADHAKRA